MHSVFTISTKILYTTPAVYSILEILSHYAQLSGTPTVGYIILRHREFVYNMPLISCYIGDSCYHLYISIRYQFGITHMADVFPSTWYSPIPMSTTGMIALLFPDIRVTSVNFLCHDSLLSNIFSPF